MANSMASHRPDCGCRTCRLARLTVDERFDAKVERTASCWLWRGKIGKNGYGQFNAGDGRVVYAHRFAYERAHGPITPAVEVCHRCDNPPCVRDDHLFAGTHADNMADMVAKGRTTRNSRGGTACARGHAYTPENTYTRPNGHRKCRTCDAAAQQRRQSRGRR